MLTSSALAITGGVISALSLVAGGGESQPISRLAAAVTNPAVDTIDPRMFFILSID